MKYFSFLFILFFAFSLNAQVPSYVPLTGLQGWWPFCGNANDYSSNNRNGTVIGATLTIDRFGNTNNAYSLNGNTNSIYINNAFFDAGWTNYSISGWYYINIMDNPNNTSKNHAVFNTAPHNGVELSSNWGGSKKHSFLVGNGAPATSWNVLLLSPCTQTLTIGAWKHFVFIKSATTYELYIDGILDKSTTTSTTISSYLYKMYFGNIDPNTANEGLNGKIDDYGIWNRKLTQTEITALYNGTSPCNTVAATSSFSVHSNSICLGQSITFTNTSTFANSYNWSFGDGNTSTVLNPTYTYNFPGTYTVNLTSVGSTTATSSSVINVIPNPTISINSTSIICLGNNAILTASGANTYTWSSSGIQSSTIAVSPTITSIYTVTGTSTLGCLSQSVYTVIVNPLPTISIVGSNTMCSSDNVILQGSGSNTYTWQPLGINSSSITVSPNVNTSYTLFGTSNFGCIGSKTYSVSVFPLANYTLTASSSSICSGESIIISGIGANTYTLIGTGVFSNSISVIPPIGLSTFSIIGATNVGCVKNQTINITVIPTPTLELIGDSIVCLGYNTQLTAISNANSISWFNTQSTTSIIITPTNSAYYSAIAFNGACVISDSIFIRIANKDSANFIYSIIDSCSGQVDFACLNFNQNNYWQISNGASVLNNCHFVLNLNSSQNVTHITNPNTQCSDTMSQFIKIQILSNNELLPNVLTPNNDNVNDIINFENFFPCGNIEINIFDRWGILVANLESGKNTVWQGRTTSGQKCSDGVYFYFIKTKDKNYQNFIMLYN